MTPITPSHVLPQILDGDPEPGLQIPPVPVEIRPTPLQIGASGPMVGTTPDAVLPVLPNEGTLPVEPVNPVNNGNQAGLPQMPVDSVTDGITPKTFKLPTSVMIALQRTVDRLNDVSPGNTTHSLGVNLLSRHEELLGSAKELADYKSYCERLSSEYMILRAQLNESKTQRIALTRQLETERQTRSTPPSERQPEPILPPGSPAEETWRIRYLDIQQELRVALEAHGKDKQAAQPLYELFKVLPELLEQLYLEAERHSYYTVAHYQLFFQELLAPYLV